MKKVCYRIGVFPSILVLSTKYILFIAMDLALYPFLLVLFIGKCIKEKIQIAH